jgi:hypothetical protein
VLAGNADHIFPKYLHHLDAALRDFCDKHWVCEFVMRDVVPDHLQASLNAANFHHNMRVSALVFRCVNIRHGHPKGHQLANGRVFAYGGYQSSISFKGYHKAFQENVYFRLQHLLARLAETTTVESGYELAAASKIHKDYVLAFFFRNRSRENIREFNSHSVCLCCLFGYPEVILPCGHALCMLCAKAYGRVRAKQMLEIHECPLEANAPGRCESLYTYLKPSAAGFRILALDGGGFRSIVQLEILQMLEYELGGKIPIQYFFDLIVGKGAGGLVALGLAARNWSISECSNHADQIYQKGLVKLGGTGGRGVFSKLKYETATFETTLKDHYTEGECLFGTPTNGNRSRYRTKAAIVATLQNGNDTLLTNYNRRPAKKSSYQFCRPDKPEQEIKMWEAARATMTDPKLFKPYHHETSKQVFADRKNALQNPALIAYNEFKTLSDDPALSSEYPDILISIGIGADADHDEENEMKKIYRLSTTESQLSTVDTRLDRQESRNDSGNTQLKNQRAWNDLIRSEAISPSRARFIRLNPILESELPPFRDSLYAEVAKDLVRRSMNVGHVKTLAAQLFATLFYFDVPDTVTDVNEEYFVIQGHILCRIPDDTPEIAEVGKLLRINPEGIPYFCFVEQGGNSQRYSISPTAIRDMIEDLKFKLPHASLQLTRREAIVEAYLCFKGQQHPISGFPRPLIPDPAFVMSKCIKLFLFLLNKHQEIRSHLKT